MTLDEKIDNLINRQSLKGRQIDFFDGKEKKDQYYTITCIKKGTKKSDVGIIIDSNLLLLDAIDLKQIKNAEQRKEALQYINYLKNNTLNKDAKPFSFKHLSFLRYTFSFNEFNDETFENYARTRWGVFDFQWNVSCLDGNKEKVVSCFNDWSSLKKDCSYQLEVLKMLIEQLGQEFYDLIEKRLTICIKSPLEREKTKEEIKKYFHDTLNKSRDIDDSLNQEII